MANTFDYSKLIYGGDIADNIRKKLEDRQNLSAGEESDDLYKSIGTNNFRGEPTLELSSRTPWIRIWTAIQQYTTKFSEDFINVEKDKLLNIKIYQLGNNVFNDYNFSDDLLKSVDNRYENTGRMVGDNEVGKYIPDELSNNEFMKPSAGIKSLNVSTTGKQLGTIKRIKVDFTVFNKYDFDNIYERYFLKPGAKIFIDYGWDTANSYNPAEYIDNAGDIVGTDVVQKFFSSGSPQAKSNGDMETLFGIVTKFDAKVRTDGGFDCSLDIVSQNAIYLLGDTGESISDNTKKTIIDNLDKIAMMIYSKYIAGNTYNFKNLLNLNWIDNAKAEDILSYIGGKRFLMSGDGKKSNVVTVGKVRKPKTVFDTHNKDVGVYFLKRSVDDGNNKITSNIYITLHFLKKYILPLLDIESSVISEDPSFFLMNDTLLERQRNLASSEKFKVLYYDDNFSNRGVITHELFINTTLISDAINKHNSIVNILEYILDEINNNSNGFHDFKLCSADTSCAGIKIIDDNLNTLDTSIKVETKKPDGSTTYEEMSIVFDELFEFKPHTKNSLLKGVDIGFNIGSGKYSSMMAIQGSASGGKYFSLNNQNLFSKDTALKTLNDLVEGDKSYDWAYLPNNVEPKEKQLVNTTYGDQIDIFNEKFKTIFEYIEINETSVISLDDYIEDLNKKVTDAKKEYDKKITNEIEKRTQTKVQKLTKTGEHIHYVNTFKDYYDTFLKKRINSKIDFQPNYNPAIMGLTLELDLYGIAGLQIGNAFRMNYLPRKYQNFVYFIITEMTHDITSSGWKTHVKSQFRIDYRRLGKDRDWVDLLENSKIWINKGNLAAYGWNETQVEDIMKDPHLAFTSQYKVLTDEEIKEIDEKSKKERDEEEEKRRKKELAEQKKNEELWAEQQNKGSVTDIYGNEISYAISNQPSKSGKATRYN